MLLVVDGEELARKVTARILTKAGYLVVTASSGDQALRLVDGMRTRKFQLVIADVSMPGMNGPELAERLRQRPSAPPVLFMSGATSPRGLRGLAAPCLQKPVSERALLQQVRRLLGEGRAASQ